MELLEAIRRRARADSSSPISHRTAGEILAQAMPYLERNIHPVVIISAFKRALEEALVIIDQIAIPVDPSNEESMLALIKTSIGTKFVSRWSDMMCQLALRAIRIVAQDDATTGVKTVDLKRYAKVEKVPGGEIEDSRVLDGVMLNKDVTHPKMRRRIEYPRVVLLDCPLEYKKGESQTNIEVSKEEDWNRILEIEEEQIKQMCDRIVEFKPDLVFTEKGISGPWPTPFLPRSQGSARLTRKSFHHQTSRNTTSSRPTLPRSGGSASRTTTGSRARPARRSSTASTTCARATSAPSAACSTLKSSETSACCLSILARREDDPRAHG